MQKSIVIGLIVVVLIVAAAFMFGGNDTATPLAVEQNATSTDSNTNPNTNSTGTITGTVTSSTPTTTTSTPVTSAVKTFNIAASSFKFSLSEMRVKKGDTVRINLTNTGGTHDLKIDEFNVATDKLTSGGSDTVEFVVNKTGTFEFYCSVGTHRQMGMRGNLIVE